MSYLDGEVFLEVKHPSGTRILEVVKRPDGVGYFVEWTQEYDEYAGDYWSPSHQSGLYASAEDALMDARNSQMARSRRISAGRAACHLAPTNSCQSSFHPQAAIR
jgi:hypothetical protein